MIASRFAASGVDIGGAARGAWAVVDAKGLSVLLDCMPRPTPYAAAVEELRSTLGNKQVLKSDEITTVALSVAARAASS